MQKLYLILISCLSVNCFGYFSANGTWKGQVADESKNRPCLTEYKVEQTEHKLTIAERVYNCQDRYVLNQKSFSADIEPVNASLARLVSGGESVGIIEAASMQITTNAEEMEALVIQAGPNNKVIKVREMLNTKPTKTTLAGIATLVE